MNGNAQKVLGSAVIAMLALSAEVQAQATDVDCDGCVDTGDIANQAVARAKLGNGSVGTAQIGNQQVNRGKIASGAIGSPQIGNQQVTGSKFVSGAVGFAQIGSFQVTEDKLADNSVSGSKLAIGAVSVDPAMIRRTLAGQACRWNLSGQSPTGYWVNSGQGCGGVAAVKLPDGVELTELECTFFNGANASGNMNARLVRRDRASQSAEAVFITDFTTPNDTIQTVNDTVPENSGRTFVDNAQYSYSVGVTWGDASDGLDAQFSGCAIGYE